MPPPPPSASYTWKFDSVTDDESTDSDLVARRRQTINEISASKSQDSSSEGEEEEPQPNPHVAEWWAIAPSSSSSKQNRGKRNKKKNRKKNKQKKKTKGIVVVVQKKLCFGNVYIQEYERCLGVDAVPLDGSWPLGIGNKCINSDLVLVSIDQYEDQKQIRLQERLSKLDKNGENELMERLQRQDTLETRQWDFRSGSKNPLFHLITEEKRMEILLQYSEPDSSVALSAPKSTPPTSKHKSLPRGGGSGNLVERFNDVFTKADVSHFRVQLEDIRAKRSIQDSTGCSCHRLKVYIPPQQGGGKTAQKKRLAINKVKTELRKRNLLPKDNHALGREELERILHDVVEKEGCCNYDCPCAENGIECQADACDCWQSSKQPETLKQEGHNGIIITDISTRCGNPNGMYTVDLKTINDYRRNVLLKLTICPPVLDEDDCTAKPAVNTKVYGRKLSKIAT